ncbi:BlaI/MecI/CopY family transcriptional regulator [uncultured Oscillibacter sp.]|uniref:BlaI/MecI/CopY family transcriptional regulator n=1 Tax=uncultured Oscillibacter sp. TaxID=876091 RepID=UPI0025DE2EC9|nr:BlaI/MecI/CopY family transcriptional regulator [uncultured Oscillibacter sp.]
MSDLKMAPVETRFAEIIWAHEPVSSAELVKLAEEALGWKKSTTYTVLRRLCERGIFRNEGGAVTSLLSRADYDAAQSRQFVEESFSGSLPAFIAAFTRRKKLTDEEVAELQSLIDRNRR